MARQPLRTVPATEAVSALADRRRPRFSADADVVARGRPSHAAPAWAWAITLLPIATWEIFLRLDSRVVSLPTKLWFFPLLAIAATAAASEIGRLIAQLASLIGGERAETRIQRGALMVFAASAYASEYAGLTYYHAPESIGYWPASAALGVACALAADISTRRWIVAGKSDSQLGSLVRRIAVVLLAAAVLVAVIERPDIASLALRPNTLFGRMISGALFAYKPHPWPTHAAAAHPPDLPSVRKLSRGNVILVSVDALRADFVSPFDPQAAPTPRIQKLAGQSVLFENAFAVRPTSAPSMASILTGLYPANHGVRDNAVALQSDVRTLAETLSSEGYATAGFVTNINFSTTFNFQQGFGTYEYLQPARDRDGLITDSSDPEVVDASLAWARTQSGRRIFLWAHLNAPHSPYLPPSSFRPELQPGKGPWFNVFNMPSHLARVEGLRTYFDRGVYLKLYEAEVASIDVLVGRLLDGLDALGMLDDAQVIFLADHGEAFGEGDAFGHGESLSPAETRVPLLWRMPGALRGGARVSTVVQLVDLVPTLLDVTGHDSAPRRDGRILSGILLGETQQDDGFAFSEAGWPGAIGVRSVTYAARNRRRAVWLGGEFPLALDFDRLADPAERRWLRYEPRADDPLFATLQQLAAEATSERAHAPATVPLDSSQTERLRALGYVQ